MKPELENIVIQYSSIPIAILLAGSVSPEIRAPIENGVKKVYEYIKYKLKKEYKNA